MTLRISFLFIVLWGLLLVNPPVQAAVSSSCLTKVTYVKIAVSMKLKGITEEQAKDVLMRFYDEIEHIYAMDDNSELRYYFEVIEQCKRGEI